MTTLMMKHLAGTISRNRDVSVEVVFHLDGVDVPVGASWYRREANQEIGETEHPVLEQTLRVPIHLLPREPKFRDTVTVAGVLRRVESCNERGPQYLVTLKG